MRPAAGYRTVITLSPFKTDDASTPLPPPVASLASVANPQNLPQAADNVDSTAVTQAYRISQAEKQLGWPAGVYFLPEAPQQNQPILHDGDLTLFQDDGWSRSTTTRSSAPSGSWR